MINRSTKVIITVVVVIGLLYLLFNYYLPANIVSVEPIGARGRAAQRAGAPKNTETKPSIADRLGVARPKRIRYARFDPQNIKREEKRIRDIFKVPPEISDEVNFWKDIYTKYDKTKVVFHDKKHMGIVYSVIDISDIVNNDKLSDDEKMRLRADRVTNEYNRIVGILEGLDDKGYGAMTPEEKKIYHLFDDVDGEKKFEEASFLVRSQTGIADKFREGIKAAGRYLGEMERIFADSGVPLEITRLAFVESMFNLDALSKAGASGIWQFMPDTGRLFMTIDQIVDERNDPIRATKGAAALLLRDYDILKSWPLTINAYNAGRLRLERAVDRLGTRDIARIIKEFEHPGYGFASRNFYPAFLAALNVFENREDYFGKIEMDEPLTFDLIETPSFTTLPELAEYTGIPAEEIHTLNFGLRERVVEGRLPIPKGFPLRVPAGRGESVLVAIDEMNGLAKYAKWHTVRPGETLVTIAAKYGTSVSAIKAANDMRLSRVKAGQILKLPAGISLAKE